MGDFGQAGKLDFSKLPVCRPLGRVNGEVGIQCGSDSGGECDIGL